MAEEKLSGETVQVAAQTADGTLESLENIYGVLGLIAEFLSTIRDEERLINSSRLSVSNMISSAIYKINGEVIDSDVLMHDPTLPEISEIGTKIDHINATYETVTSALDFMVANSDSFQTADPETE
jgi:hypothetical protein